MHHGPDLAALAAIVKQTRLVFHRLRALGDRLHRDVAVSTAMRGVMESLAEAGPQTVPQLARARPVARQQIQVVVDALVRAALVEARANPAHRRSALIALTARGERLFAAMKRKEARVLEQLARTLPARDLAAAARVLEALSEALGTLLAPEPAR
jgi:DNA-binding MarR family transcriptional regulator